MNNKPKLELTCTRLLPKKSGFGGQVGNTLRELTYE